jgi:hypothetical protein
MKNMLRIRYYLSEKLVFSLWTNGAEHWCCERERSETQCSRPPEIRFETVWISSRRESPPCWQCELQFRNDCSLEVRLSAGHDVEECAVTENFLLSVTPSALRLSTLGMPGTAGSGIAIALRLLGGTNTISIDLAWFICRLLELAQSQTWLILSSHEILLEAGIIK